MTHTDEQTKLLALARQLYPPGTVYMCVNDETKYTIRPNDKLRFYEGNPNKIDDFGIGFVYYEGQWAKIITYNKPINTDYDIF